MRSLLPILAIALALGACHQSSPQTQNDGANASSPVGPPPAPPEKGADRSHKGSPMIGASIVGPDGKDTSLKAFTGRPTLVNLWASWCAPCVKELPTLDRLAVAQDGKLNVVAVSQDMAPKASVEAFLKGHKIAHLKAYRDPKMALSGALGPDTVLPTSILYDASGKEVWRYVGDLDWTSPKAAKLLAEGGASQTR